MVLHEGQRIQSFCEKCEGLTTFELVIKKMDASGFVAHCLICKGTKFFTNKELGDSE